MDESSPDLQSTVPSNKVRTNGWIENCSDSHSRVRLPFAENIDYTNEINGLGEELDSELATIELEPRTDVDMTDCSVLSNYKSHFNSDNNLTDYATFNVDTKGKDKDLLISETNTKSESDISDAEEDTVIENHRHETEVVTALISDCGSDSNPAVPKVKSTIVDVHVDNTDSGDVSVNCEGDDTFTSMIDLEKINSIKSKRSSSKKSGRKESFEQRLRRTFTIKDEHQSEVAKRILALVVKYSLFVFNFLSWVMATGGIGIGIWMMCDRTIIITTNTDIYLDPPKLTVIGGGITFIVALLGCVGALRENLVLLKVFFYVLSVILVGEMILGLTVFIIYTVPQARDNFLRSQPEKLLQMAIANYMDDTEVKTWVDMIQSKTCLTPNGSSYMWKIDGASTLALHYIFKCCGISHTEEGFRDWSSSPYFNCTPSNKSIYRCAVPMSCCIFEAGDRVNTMCGFDMTNKPVIEVRDYIFVRGCMQGFGEWLSKYDELIIVSCLSVLIMQFLAVLSAKLMVVRITKKRSRWKVLHRRYSSYTSNSATIPESD